MSAYMTEEEQLERIKQWWKQYGTAVTTFVSILLILWSGYKYWGWHQEKVLGEASKVYENLIYAASKEDDKSLRAFAHQLIQEYPKTIYAEIARLSLAKFYAEHGQRVKAKEELAAVSSRMDRRVFKELAEIRKARILITEKSYDEALALLKSINNSPFNPIIHELEGDVYAVSPHQLVQALVSYQLALGEVQMLGLTNHFLEMKINDLAVRVGNVSASEAAPAITPQSKTDELSSPANKTDNSQSENDEERPQSEVDTD